MSTSTLLAALYVFVGLAIFLIGFLTYHVYRQAPDYRSATGTLVGTRLGSADSSLTGADRVRLMHGPGQLARLQQRMNELETSLQQASSMLEKRTSELQKKDDECRALQADLDESLTVAFDLLAEESQFRPASIEEEESGAIGADTESRFEFERLKAELQKSEFLATEQAQRLEELRAEVVRAEAEIADIQMAAEQEIDALLAGQQSQESVAARTLIQTGKRAVPSLMGLLADDSEEVRAFAAYVLGEIGSDADEATTTLLSLLSDPNETVRDQSRQALSKIAPLSNL